jgi:hypothetical protein
MSWRSYGWHSPGTRRAAGHPYDVGVKERDERGRRSIAPDAQTNEISQRLRPPYQGGEQAPSVDASLRADDLIEIERQIDVRNVTDGPESESGNVPFPAFPKDRSALHVDCFRNRAQQAFLCGGYDDGRRAVQRIDPPRSAFEGEHEH